jgi:hypothetical protein
VKRPIDILLRSIVGNRVSVIGTHMGSFGSFTEHYRLFRLTRLPSFNALPAGSGFGALRESAPGRFCCKNQRAGARGLGRSVFWGGWRLGAVPPRVQTVARAISGGCRFTILARRLRFCAMAASVNSNAVFGLRGSYRAVSRRPTAALIFSANRAGCEQLRRPCRPSLSIVLSEPPARGQLIRRPPRSGSGQPRVR